MDTSKESEAIQAAETYQSVDNTGDPAEAEKGFYKIPVKDADDTPNNGSNDN